jgi:hypothetical protein
MDGHTTSDGLTRRSLLAGGGAAALAFALPAAATAVRSTRSHLRRSTYSGLVGQRFAVQGTSAAIALTAVSDLTAHQRGSEDAFALRFHAPAGVRLADVPTLRHARLGSFALFLTPGAGQSYTAVVNRTHG